MVFSLLVGLSLVRTVPHNDDSRLRRSQALAPGQPDEVLTSVSRAAFLAAVGQGGTGPPRQPGAPIIIGGLGAASSSGREGAISRRGVRGVEVEGAEGGGGGGSVSRLATSLGGHRRQVCRGDEQRH